jgi:hypothetical protein
MQITSSDIPEFLENKSDFARIESIQVIPDTIDEVLTNFLSKCVALQSINLGGNNPHSLDVPRLQALGAALAGCPALQSIDLSGNNLHSLDVARLQALGAVLAGCPALQSIDLSFNNLHRLDNNRFDALCTSLKECKFLFEIKGTNFLSAERQAALKKICDENRARIVVAMDTLSRVEATIPQMPEKHLPQTAKDLVFSYLTGQSQEEINKRRPSEGAASSSSNSDNNNNKNNNNNK